MILRLLALRLALGVITLIIVSIVIFFSVEFLPGDFAESFLGQAATPESLAALRDQLGLNQPVVVRYCSWLASILSGDLGTSLSNGRSISQLILARLGNTLSLALYAAAIAIPLAVGLGLLTAMFRNSVLDRVVNITALTAVSLPEFLVAYLLVYGFTQQGLFPAIADVTPSTELLQRLYMMFLPALSLTLAVGAHMLRMTRAAIINVLAAPYIEMAHLKGVTQGWVILMHAFPNALAPVINVIALNLAYLITGVVVVETVFAYPGLGKLLVDSVSRRDLPVVQAASLLFAAIYVFVNLIADILSTLSNPRLRYPE